MGEHATARDAAPDTYVAKRHRLDSAVGASTGWVATALAAALLVATVGAAYALGAGALYVLVANAGWAPLVVGISLVLVFSFALCFGFEAGQLRRRFIRDSQRVERNATVLDDDDFQRLLDEVHDLHRRTDEVARLHESIRSQLRSRHGAPLPAEQRELAQKVVETLSMPRLSSKRTRYVYETYFGYR